MNLPRTIAELVGKADIELVENAIRSAKRTAGAHMTPFMGRSAAEELRLALQEDADVSYRVFGGYRGASRVRFALAPAGYKWEGFEADIVFFRIEGQIAEPEEMMLYIKASGLQESEIGDIFESGCGTAGVAGADAAAKLCSKGIDVRGVPVQVSICDPSEIALPGQQARPIKATVSSLRLDAVAAAGFPASRTRLSQEIEIGRVKLCGKVVSDPAAKVRQGDVIVIRGRGRLTVDELGQKTARGRTPVKLSKYSVL